MFSKHHGNVELRYHDDGDLDEIVILDARGQCYFHLEQMGDDSWWARFYSTPAQPMAEELVLNVGRNRRAIEVRAEMESPTVYRGNAEALRATMGKWPGDETDEQIRQALGELS